MKLHCVVPVMVALISTACSQIPVETTARPDEVIVRATVFTSCLPGPGCPEASVAKVRGPLVFAEGDSLVMTDLASGRRTTIRSGAGLLLEVYRGQRRTPRAVAKGAGIGTLAGIALLVGSALVSDGVAEVVGKGASDSDLGDLLAASAVAGAGVGFLSGAARGHQEGEAVWERVTVLQLRQQLCRCAQPDAVKHAAPAERLVPQG